MPLRPGPAGATVTAVQRPRDTDEPAVGSRRRASEEDKARTGCAVIRIFSPARSRRCRQSLGTEQSTGRVKLLPQGDRMKIVLDLHPIFRNNRDIDLALREVIFKAARTGATVVEIIPGKGSGRLQRRGLSFLGQKHITKL